MKLDKYGLAAAQNIFNEKIGETMPSAAVRELITNLAMALRDLSGAVIDTAEAMHLPPAPIGGLNQACGPIAAQSWIDDLRDTASFAIRRADLAQREIHNIRNTLGL